MSMEMLGKKALKGTAAVALNNYASLLTVFISGVLLARILNPVDFGIYRLALFYVDLFGRVREFGLDKALIHRQQDLNSAFKAHFTLHFLLSILSLLLTIIFAPLILRFYSVTVFLFILAISISYVFLSLSATQRIYLEKNLQFNRTALVDIAALIVSSSLSVYLAFRGFGALSLVAGYGFNNFLVFVFLWLMRPWKVRPVELFLFDRKLIFWFLKFGLFLFVGGLTTFILYKYNDFVLGTFLSVAALGFYSRAFNYAQLPTSLITSVISKVALPTYSALQDDSNRLALAFTIVLKNIIRVSFPFTLILFITAEDFTVFLLGGKWLPMVPIFRILLIYGVLRSIFDDLGELFTAAGRPKYVSFYLLIQAILSLIISPILTFFFKAEGAALSLSLVLLVGVLIAYYLLGRVIRIRSLPVFLPTLAVSFLTLFSYAAFTMFLPLDFESRFLSFAGKSVVISSFYVFFLVIIDGSSLRKDFSYILSHLRDGAGKNIEVESEAGVLPEKGLTNEF